MSSKDLIINLPNPHLRQKSKRIAVITDETRSIIEDMKAATLDWEASRKHELGVALAAIQVDKALRIIIVRNDFENKDDKSFAVFINPQITKLEGEVEEDFEGCLSITDMYGKVPRHTKVRIRALDEEGREIRLKAEGFLARVFQHEIDHTNGLTFVDHIEDNPGAFYELTPEGKLKKLEYEKIRSSGIFRD